MAACAGMDYEYEGGHEVRSFALISKMRRTERAISCVLLRKILNSGFGPMLPPFYRLRLLEETASTNSDAKAAAESGEAGGLVVMAKRQTAGRGRHGRRWESPEGNFYASILLRPWCSPQEAGYYSFVTALAVYDALRVFLPRSDITLKWPNDVLVEKKKISGILLEAAPSIDNVINWLVVGVGINVCHHPGTGVYPATSLVAEGAGNATPDAMLGRFLESFEIWRRELESKGFAAIRTAWLAHAQTGPVTVRLSDGVISGDFAGFDELGRFMLRLPDGAEKAIAAGDVFFRSPDSERGVHGNGRDRGKSARA